MLSTNTNFFTAGVELEYKCSIGYEEMHRRLQAAGFTWAKAMYDGSPSPMPKPFSRRCRLMKMASWNVRRVTSLG